jgi:hypothetical protein
MSNAIGKNIKRIKIREPKLNETIAIESNFLKYLSCSPGDKLNQLLRHLGLLNI